MSRTNTTAATTSRRASSQSGGGASLAEHSMAILTAPMTLRDGRTLPSGTRGTIVFVYANGAAYEVEFDKPVRAVVTIEAPNLREASPS